METARGHRRDAGPRTIAIEHHADTEQRRAQRYAEQIGRLDVILGVADLLQQQHAEAADNDRGEHDFQHRASIYLQRLA